MIRKKYEYNISKKYKYDMSNTRIYADYFFKYSTKKKKKKTKTISTIQIYNTPNT